MEDTLSDKIAYAALSMQQLFEELKRQGYTGRDRDALNTSVVTWFEETIKEKLPNIDSQGLLVAKGIMLALLMKRDFSDLSESPPYGMDEISQSIMQALGAIYATSE